MRKTKWQPAERAPEIIARDQALRDPNTRRTMIKIKKHDAPLDPMAKHSDETQSSPFPSGLNRAGWGGLV